jgi:hypothetical protein
MAETLATGTRRLPRPPAFVVDAAFGAPAATPTASVVAPAVRRRAEQPPMALVPEPRLGTLAVILDGLTRKKKHREGLRVQ